MIENINRTGVGQDHLVTLLQTAADSRTLQLRSSFVRSSKVKNVSLASMRYPEGSEVFVAGLGSTTSPHYTMAYILQGLTLPIRPDSGEKDTLHRFVALIGAHASVARWSRPIATEKSTVHSYTKKLTYIITNK